MFNMIMTTITTTTTTTTIVGGVVGWACKAGPGLSAEVARRQPKCASLGPAGSSQVCPGRRKRYSYSLNSLKGIR